MGDQPCSGDLRKSLQTRHWEGASARWEAVGWGSFQGGPVEVTPAESGLGVGVPVLDLPEIDTAAQFRCRVRNTVSPSGTEKNCERECAPGEYNLKARGAVGSSGTLECRSDTTLSPGVTSTPVIQIAK